MNQPPVYNTLNHSSQQSGPYLLPLLFRLIARKYIWLTLPLTALAEVLLNWDSFCYYEARSLALLFTLTQLAVMAVFVWILQAAAKSSR